MKDDLIKALSEAGETFNKDCLNNIPKTNDSDLDGYPPKHWARYTKILADKVMAVESDVIRKYYHNVSPNSLVEFD